MTPYQRAMVLATGILVLAVCFVWSATHGDLAAFILVVALWALAIGIWVRAEVVRHRGH